MVLNFTPLIKRTPSVPKLGVYHKNSKHTTEIGPENWEIGWAGQAQMNKRLQEKIQNRKIVKKIGPKILQPAGRKDERDNRSSIFDALGLAGLGGGKAPSKNKVCGGFGGAGGGTPGSARKGEWGPFAHLPGPSFVK